MTLEEYKDAYRQYKKKLEEAEVLKEKISAKVLEIIKNTKDQFASCVSTIYFENNDGKKIVCGDFGWHCRGYGDKNYYEFPEKWLDDEFDYMAEFRKLKEQKKKKEEEKEREQYERLKKKFEKDV